MAGQPPVAAPHRTAEGGGGLHGGGPTERRGAVQGSDLRPHRGSGALHTGRGRRHDRGPGRQGGGGGEQENLLCGGRGERGQQAAQGGGAGRSGADGGGLRRHAGGVERGGSYAHRRDLGHPRAAAAGDGGAAAGRGLHPPRGGF